MRVRATPHRLNEIKPLDGSIRGGISDGNTRLGPETTRLERRGGNIVGGDGGEETAEYTDKRKNGRQGGKGRDGGGRLGRRGSQIVQDGARRIMAKFNLIDF